MRALQLVKWGAPAVLRDVPIPEPGPGEVLLEIMASGACHSDLHLMERPGGGLPWRLPFTLGHEAAGRVHSIGAGVRGWAEGDPALVYGAWGCGLCLSCRRGRENYCERAASIPAAGGGLGLDGGMAEYMLVPSARHLVPIGALDPVQAAPLADAALTPYHVIKAALDRLYPGSTAVVIGAGGLGHMAIQLLRALSATQVIAVDRDPPALAAAQEFGASAVVAAGASAAEQIRHHTGGHGADLVIDLVGSDDSLALGARVLKAMGRLALVGLALGGLPFNFFTVPYGAEVATSYWGTIPELMEIVALARSGRIRVAVQAFPLEHAVEVYERLRAGEVQGRAVVVPR